MLLCAVTLLTLVFLSAYPGSTAWTRLEMELGIDTSKILSPVETISPTGAEVIHSGSSEE